MTIENPQERNPGFTYIDEHGLLGTNFYWRKREQANMTEEELTRVGLTSERVQVHQDIIKPLQDVDAALRQKGYRLYITEGYRSPELYQLVNEKMKARLGEEKTKSILNMAAMPHATGRTIDLSLWNEATNDFVPMRNKAHKTDAYFIDYYKDSKDPEEQNYQALQEMVIGIMLEHGFRLGTKREYFHFNYDPGSPYNYKGA